jgi:hypothetical protein
MTLSSKLLVKLHVDGKKTGFAYGACIAGRFSSSRIEMKRMAGKGKCKNLYSYYLRCATELNSVREYSAVMYSHNQNKICSCILGAMRLTFGDAAEFQCYSGGMNDSVDEEPIAIGENYREFCADAALWPEITVRLRPAHGRVILVPRPDAPFPADERHVFSAYFTYFNVSPHACRHRHGACATIPPHVDAYIHSRLLQNFTTLGEVFSTGEKMHLQSWPIARQSGGRGGAVDFDLKHGYKLLKYHFTQVYRSRTMPYNPRNEEDRRGRFEVWLTGYWEEDMLQLMCKALLKAFTASRLEYTGEVILVTFDRR